jgi:hypothetical protein
MLLVLLLVSQSQPIIGSGAMAERVSAALLGPCLSAIVSMCCQMPKSSVMDRSSADLRLQIGVFSAYLIFMESQFLV